MFVRVVDEALNRNDELLIAELGAFLSHRDYFVKAVRGGLEVVPYNAISREGDHKRLQGAVDRWAAEHPSARVEVTR